MKVQKYENNSFPEIYFLKIYSIPEIFNLKTYHFPIFHILQAIADNRKDEKPMGMISLTSST